MDEIGAGIVSSPGPSRRDPGHARVARALGTGIVAGQFAEGAALPAEPAAAALAAEAALDVVFRMSRPTDPQAHEISWRAHAAIRAGDPAAAARATEVVVRDGLRNGAAAVEAGAPRPTLVPTCPVR